VAPAATVLLVLLHGLYCLASFLFFFFASFWQLWLLSFDLPLRQPMQALQTKL
jgi:hypothetical protein